MIFNIICATCWEILHLWVSREREREKEVFLKDMWYLLFFVSKFPRDSGFRSVEKLVGGYIDTELASCDATEPDGIAISLLSFSFWSGIKLYYLMSAYLQNAVYLLQKGKLPDVCLAPTRLVNRPLDRDTLFRLHTNCELIHLAQGYETSTV